MKNKAIDYPHPVLNDYNSDFKDCSFSVNLTSHSDTGDSLLFEFEYDLKAPGIEALLNDNKAKMVLRISCQRTSFRTAVDMNLNGPTTVTILKKNVSGVLTIQGMIVAVEVINEYKLDEFNPSFFSNAFFSLRKGDIIASEPGVKITLNTILEKSMAGIVFINFDPNIDEMKVHYASIEDGENPETNDYIYITLPEKEYDNYAKLMTKKHLKNGIERFLQGSIVLPAITEAVSKLRFEELIEENDLEYHYRGTKWADAVYASLVNYGIEELSTSTKTDYEIANKLLGNVVFDSIDNLMQKMTEWSTIVQEDEAL